MVFAFENQRVLLFTRQGTLFSSFKSPIPVPISKIIIHPLVDNIVLLFGGSHIALLDTNYSSFLPNYGGNPTLLFIYKAPQEFGNCLSAVFRKNVSQVSFSVGSDAGRVLRFDIGIFDPKLPSATGNGHVMLDRVARQTPIPLAITEPVRQMDISRKAMIFRFDTLTGVYLEEPNVMYKCCDYGAEGIFGVFTFSNKALTAACCLGDKFSCLNIDEKVRISRAISPPLTEVPHLCTVTIPGCEPGLRTRRLPNAQRVLAATRDEIVLFDLDERGATRELCETLDLTDEERENAMILTHSWTNARESMEIRGDRWDTPASVLILSRHSEGARLLIYSLRLTESAIALETRPAMSEVMQRDLEQLALIGAELRSLFNLRTQACTRFLDSLKEQRENSTPIEATSISLSGFTAAPCEIHAAPPPREDGEQLVVAPPPTRALPLVTRPSSLLGQPMTQVYIKLSQQSEAFLTQLAKCREENCSFDSFELDLSTLERQAREYLQMITPVALPQPEQRPQLLKLGSMMLGRMNIVLPWQAGPRTSLQREESTDMTEVPLPSLDVEPLHFDGHPFSAFFKGERDSRYPLLIELRERIDAVTMSDAISHVPTLGELQNETGPESVTETGNNVYDDLYVFIRDNKEQLFVLAQNGSDNCMKFVSRCAATEIYKALALALSGMVQHPDVSTIRSLIPPGAFFEPVAPKLIEISPDLAIQLAEGDGPFARMLHSTIGERGALLEPLRSTLSKAATRSLIQFVSPADAQSPPPVAGVVSDEGEPAVPSVPLTYSTVLSRSEFIDNAVDLLRTSPEIAQPLLLSLLIRHGGESTIHVAREAAITITPQSLRSMLALSSIY